MKKHTIITLAIATAFLIGGNLTAQPRSRHQSPWELGPGQGSKPAQPAPAARPAEQQRFVAPGGKPGNGGPGGRPGNGGPGGRPGNGGPAAGPTRPSPQPGPAVKPQPPKTGPAAPKPGVVTPQGPAPGTLKPGPGAHPGPGPHPGVGHPDHNGPHPGVGHPGPGPHPGVGHPGPGPHPGVGHPGPGPRPGGIKDFFLAPAPPRPRGYRTFPHRHPKSRFSFLWFDYLPSGQVYEIKDYVIYECRFCHLVHYSPVVPANALCPSMPGQYHSYQILGYYGDYAFRCATCGVTINSNAVPNVGYCGAQYHVWQQLLEY
ncbi:MAG: hypothetical protein J6X49_11100 [Victivallales bacterium]|nr:hypothetical protein [Victivallales bacterium]